MRTGIPKILVTGGAGFIGSAFVRLLCKTEPPKKLFPSRDITQKLFPSCKETVSAKALNGLPKETVSALDLLPYKVIVLDKLTYAGDLARLEEVRDKYKFYKADICDRNRIEQIFKKEKPEILVHFAAETHVDRSIKDASPFIKTNVLGTQVILDISKKYKVKKFIHISTDEVYGEINKGRFNEKSPLSPNSPYAASKAAADLLVRAYMRTYHFPAVIVRFCNTYGPWQYPEKFIPIAISNAMKNKEVPVYGKGLNVREWLYVGDCVVAILKIIRKGEIGEIYNVGSDIEKKNIQVAKSILNILNKPYRLIQFIADRPSHDRRYGLDSAKFKKELGRQPMLDFDSGLKNTVEWYFNRRS